MHNDFICKYHLSEHGVVCKKAAKLFHLTHAGLSFLTTSSTYVSPQTDAVTLAQLLKGLHFELPFAPKTDTSATTFRHRSFCPFTMPNRHSIDEIQAFMDKYYVGFSFPTSGPKQDVVRLGYRVKITKRGYRAFALQSEMYADRNQQAGV